jgi:hypothetical protein
MEPASTAAMEPASTVKGASTTAGRRRTCDQQERKHKYTKK